MLNELCSEESSVDAAMIRLIEFVGLLYPLASVGIPTTVILARVVHEAHPVLFKHDLVVNRAVGTSNAEEGCNDVVRLVWEVAHVLDNLLSSLVAKCKLVLLVHQDWVVGMSYLTCSCAQYQLAISADGKSKATFVNLLAACVSTDAGIASLQVAESTGARLQRKTTHGKIDE